jgi:hypothetical protein
MRMTKYTSMCSKCKPLQEEKVLGFKDEVCYKNEIYTIINIVSSYPISLYTIKNKNYNEMPVVSPKELIYRPYLEQLIEMLEDREWSLNRGNPKTYAENWLIITITPSHTYTGKTPQEALLKLLAYECWGLTWDEEKEDWV